MNVHMLLHRFLSFDPCLVGWMFPGGENRRVVHTNQPPICFSSGVALRTNPRTEAEPQRIVAQGYSHAYSTPFHS